MLIQTQKSISSRPCLWRLLSSPRGWSPRLIKCDFWKAILLACQDVVSFHLPLGSHWPSDCGWGMDRTYPWLIGFYPKSLGGKLRCSLVTWLWENRTLLESLIIPWLPNGSGNCGLRRAAKHLSRTVCYGSTLATWSKELTHWKRPWCWERLKAKEVEGGRGWDG